jgi:hypothetical protein
LNLDLFWAKIISQAIEGGRYNGACRSQGICGIQSHPRTKGFLVIDTTSWRTSFTGGTG